MNVYQMYKIQYWFGLSDIIDGFIGEKDRDGV